MSTIRLHGLMIDAVKMAFSSSKPGKAHVDLLTEEPVGSVAIIEDDPKTRVRAINIDAFNGKVGVKLNDGREFWITIYRVGEIEALELRLTGQDKPFDTVKIPSLHPPAAA